MHSLKYYPFQQAQTQPQREHLHYFIQRFKDASHVWKGMFP